MEEKRKYKEGKGKKIMADDALAMTKMRFGEEKPARFAEILESARACFRLVPAVRLVELAIEEYDLETGDRGPPPKRREVASAPCIIPQPEGDRTNQFGPWTVTLLHAEHRYVVRHTETGQPVTRAVDSVTTLMHRMFPEFDERAALAKLSQYRRRTVYGNRTNDQISALWKANSRMAREQGTLMHSVIEACLSAAAAGDGRYCTDVLVPPSPHIPGADGRKASEPVVGVRHLEQLVALLNARGLRPVHIETCVYVDELAMAGAADALFRDGTGKYWLFDWKRRPEFTVNSKWGEAGLAGTPAAGKPACHLTEASIQLNLYAMAFSRVLGIEISGATIITIHPTLPDIIPSEIPIDTDLQRSMVVWRKAAVKDI
ncbi:MAG: hypothetical protein M0R22_10045 [Dehalococcoidia bacterium]|nr:hypothetical protein [Dehalococcoidia bacterium]